MKVLFLFWLSISLIACSTNNEVKAPCDYYGHYCGKKTHINPQE